jgi:uncharacterized delta-60 repeat protein
MVVATTALAGPVALGASSALDAGFGVAGVAVVDSGSDEATYSAVVQPDGKILAIGYTAAGTDEDALVFRLNQDGSLDQGFGYRALDGEGGYDEYASTAVVQPDGKIVVVGATDKNKDGAVWRLLPTGAPDLSFGGGDGFLPIDSAADEYANDVALAPGGKIVVVGSTSANNGEAAIYRLTPQGGFDGTFDQDGALGVGGQSYDYGLAVVVQPDGKIVMTGYFDGIPLINVYRLNVGGTPDPTFGGNDGIATVPSTYSYAYDLALQPDGRILVSGSGTNGVDEDGVVARLTTAGQVDATFGGGGGARIDLGGDETVESISLQPDGDVYALGWADSGVGNTLAKLDATGHLDTSFGTQGVTRITSGVDYAYGVASQPDGKVVVAGDDGKSNDSAVLLRFLGDAQTAAPAPRVTCQGKPATIVGTQGKDRIKGTRKVDVIVALGGNDVVKGLGGNDVVCAGDGKDRVSGGPGKDRLYGEKGKDRLVGGTGKDRLVGGPDRDTTQQ